MSTLRSLPKPNDPFEWVQAPKPALVCRPLAPVAQHLFTTRSWALGARTPGHDDEAWKEVASALDVAIERLVRVRQVHGARAVAADETTAPPEADIVVTDRADLAIAVQAADCVPLLLADPRTGAVAAAHAGWRGLAAGAPGAAVTALARGYGSHPADLVAAIGPSIGSCCYEVGTDVRDAFRSAFPAGGWTRWFLSGRRPGRWMFDAGLSAREQLEATGVRSGEIYVARLCTACHPDAFCSYRRDGAPAGRIAAAIRPRCR